MTVEIYCERCGGVVVGSIVAQAQGTSSIPDKRPCICAHTVTAYGQDILVAEIPEEMHGTIDHLRGVARVLAHAIATQTKYCPHGLCPMSCSKNGENAAQYEHCMKCVLEWAEGEAE